MTQHPLADALREAYAIIHALDLPVDHPQADALAALNKRLWQDLSQYEKSDTDRDQLREALTAEEQRAVSEELETLAKRWECSGRYSSNRVSAFYRAALASKTAIDPVTVEAREQKKSTKERLARYMDLKAFTARKVGKAQAAKLKDRREIALGRAAAAIRFFSKDENFARLSAIRALGKDQ